MATKSGKAKPDKTKKTIIDVTHADDTPASPTSRSVIVTNRPILKDPMVKEDDESPDPTKPVKLDTKEMPAPASLKEPTVAELAAAAAKKDKAAEEKPAEPTKPESKADAEPAEKPEPKPAPNTPEATPADDQTDQQKQPDQATLEAEAAKQAKHDAAVEKLIESKQYYLPIETEEKRRSKRFVALGILLSLVLILAWADIALDSGILQLNGVKPLTHFFSN